VIHVELGFTTASNFLSAEAFYTQGAYSGAYAELTLTQNQGMTASITKGTRVVGKNDAGEEIEGTVMEDLEEGAMMMRVRYKTSNVQAKYASCQVGALLVTGFETTAGCFVKEGSIQIEGKGNYNYLYDVMVDNDNDITLQKFSSNAETDKLLCDSCPHRTYQKFFNYYEVPDYGDRWIMAAFQKSETRYVRGNADFDGYIGKGRAGAIKVGITAMNLWMEVISKMEDSFDLCIAKDDQALHLWDQAVAFYTGSNEGQTGGMGFLLHALADERCGDFKTCGEFGKDLTGVAAVTESIFYEFEEGQKSLNNTDCEALRKIKRKIEDKMVVPLVQSTLRLAFTRGRSTDSERNQAEGATFAASVLPLVHDCSPEDAAIIYENMKVGSNIPNFGAVKRAFESNYHCMGISCADVGGFYDDANNKYYTDANPCTHSDGDGSNGALIQGLFFGLAVLLTLLVGWLIYRRRKRQQEAELYPTENSLVYPSQNALYQ
jgi:hypothetical protein